MLAVNDRVLAEQDHLAGGMAHDFPGRRLAARREQFLGLPLLDLAALDQRRDDVVELLVGHPGRLRDAARMQLHVPGLDAGGRERPERGEILHEPGGSHQPRQLGCRFDPRQAQREADRGIGPCRAAYGADLER